MLSAAAGSRTREYIYIYKDKFGCGCGTHKNIIKVTSKSYLEYACVLHVVVLKQRHSPFMALYAASKLRHVVRMCIRDMTYLSLL